MTSWQIFWQAMLAFTIIAAAVGALVGIVGTFFWLGDLVDPRKPLWGRVRIGAFVVLLMAVASAIIALIGGLEAPR